MGSKLHRQMNTVVRTLGKPAHLASLLVSKASAHSDAWVTEGDAPQNYCEQVVIPLFDLLWSQLPIQLHIFHEAPDCDADNIHDHPAEFASYLVKGELHQNIYTSAASWKSNGSTTDYMIEKTLAKRLRGCDDPAEFAVVPHGSRIRLHHCARGRAGDSHVFPMNWLHRPVLAGPAGKPPVTFFMTAPTEYANSVKATKPGWNPTNTVFLLHGSGKRRELLHELATYILDTTGTKGLD